MKNMKRSVWRTVILVLAGTSAAPFAWTKAGDAIPFSPFAFLPLREQSFQVSASAGVKPNIMFFVDDSGSMIRRAIPPGFDMNKYTEPKKRLPCLSGKPALYRLTTYYRDKLERVCIDEANQPPNHGFSYVEARFPLPPSVKTKMEVTKEALEAVLNDPKYKDAFQWSIQSLWGTEGSPGVVKVPGQFVTPKCPARMSVKYNRRCASWDANGMSGYGTADEVKKKLVNLTPFGRTPTTSRFLDVANIVADNIHHVCQKSFIVVMSDGDSTDVQTDFPSGVSFPLGRKPQWYEPIPNGYSPNGMSKTPRIYNQQGKVTQAGHGISFFSRQLFYRDLKKAPDGKDDEGIGWDQGVQVTDGNGNTQTLYTKQNIVTYTVGFGNALSPIGLDYLKNAASKENGNGEQYYFKADSPDELKKAFASIVGQAKTLSATTRQSTSTAKPSVAGSRRSKIPALAAFLDLDTKIWSSVLKFAVLDANGNITTDAAGKAVTRDVSYSGRKILVSDGKFVRFFANGPGYNYYGFKTKKEFDLGFAPWYQRDPKQSDEEIEKAVAAAVSPANRTVSKYRKRSKSATDSARMMGDVLDAPVVTMGEDQQTKRDKYLLTAANDGMVYIFKAQNNKAYPYKLVLNYLPAAMQRESADDSDTVGKALKALAEAGYGKTYTKSLTNLSGKQPHLYLNNGGIQYRTTSKPGGTEQMTFVAGAMGQGGRGAYLLAIGGKSRVNGNAVGLDANPINWDKTVPLGETPKGKGNKLGYTVGTPQIGRIATQWSINNNQIEQSKPDIVSGVREYLFLANGYRPADTSVPYDKEPTLYVYEALGEEMGTGGASKIPEKPGELITAIAVTNGYGGLSTPVLVDANLDGIFDHAYAGDQGGNLYRFTLIGKPSQWSVVKIYQGEVKDDGTGKKLPYQPITTKPAVYRRSKTQYIVMAGTGSRIYQSDLGSTDQQVVLGIFDDLAQTPANAVEQSKLVEQTILSTQTAQVDGKKETLRYLSKSVVPQNGKGWFLKLGGKGERMINDPATLLSTGFFTTAIFNHSVNASGPQATGALSNNAPSCKVQTNNTSTRAASYLFAIDLKTGGNPSSSSALPEYAKKHKNGNNDNAAAMKMGGTLSGAVIFSVTEQLKGTPKSINSNGAGQSGEDKLLVGGEGDGDKGPVECLESDDYKLMVTNQKGLNLKKLDVPICAASLIRVNWREVTP